VEHFPSRRGESDAAALIPSVPRPNRCGRAAAGCRACPLWRPALRPSSGGLKRARLMLIARQPGDREDVEGIRSSGPPGDPGRTLEQAGINRATPTSPMCQHFKRDAEAAANPSGAPR